MSDDVPEPATEGGRAALAALLAEPGATLIALDFDGTLAPIVERPEDARAHPRAGVVLRRLTQRVGAVAIVTGRPAADVVRLGGLEAVSGVEVRGHYGLQRWADGELDSPAEDAAVGRLREPLGALVAAAPPGTALEDKGHSLAVHTRRAADPAGTLDALRPELDRLAAESGLEAVPGRHVVELRPRGTDKGGALRELVEDRGARVVVVAGDDVGDLPALRMVRSLAESGVLGLVVCVDSAESPAELRDAADLVVDGPDGLMDWLAALADSLGI